ncbi:MAG TPA: hypothetical protein VD931_11700 [Baekduia sp.]|nr:hypothetical protein [Baekduia sp.]
METVIALSDWKANVGLIGVFFVLFPLLAHGLIGLAVGTALGEKRENREYEERGGARAAERARR